MEKNIFWVLKMSWFDIWWEVFVFIYMGVCSFGKTCLFIKVVFNSKRVVVTSPTFILYITCFRYNGHLLCTRFSLTLLFTFRSANPLEKKKQTKKTIYFKKDFFYNSRYSNKVSNVFWKKRFKHKTLRAMNIKKQFHKLYLVFQILNIEH